MRKNLVLKLLYFAYFALLTQNSFAGMMPSLSKNDPFPMYSTNYPLDFLLASTQVCLKNWKNKVNFQVFDLSITPFIQKSSYGRNINGQLSELGDLAGKWNLIGLLYGSIPQCQCRGRILQEAYTDAFFCSNTDPCNQSNTDPYIAGIGEEGPLHDPATADPEQLFGYISAPIKYRKSGIRIESTLLFSTDFGLIFEAGASNINQTLVGTECTPFQCLATQQEDANSNYISSCTLPGFCCNTPARCFKPDRATDKMSVIAPGFIDLTPLANTSNFSTGDQRVVEKYLVLQLDEILNEIRLNVNNYHKTSLEDVRLSLFWRHAFTVNTDQEIEDEFPEFLFIPFISLDAVVGTGNQVKHDDAGLTQAFALSSGSNGHNALGFTTGIGLDFYDTVEIGATVGFLHFFAEDFSNVPVPTHELQSGIYPFRTDIRIQPGTTWDFTAILNAYHFLGNTSFYGQYVFVNHNKDTVFLLKPNSGVEVSEGADYAVKEDCTDCAFLPGKLEQDTPFSVQLFNLALNYDISPNVMLGVLFQAPITQQNAYRDMTFMGTIRFVF